MNLYITVFLLFGACFGAATFAHRHLFSEGPRKVDTDPTESSAAQRVVWVLVCAFLWPLMLVSGLNTAWVLARRRAKAVRVER